VISLFRALLERVREMTLQARRTRSFPLRLAQRIAACAYSDLNPLFQVMLTLEPPSFSFRPGGIVTRVQVGAGTSRYRSEPER